MRTLKFEAGRYKVMTRRAALLAGGQVVMLGALGARMYYLQVLEADRYTTLADENRINIRLLLPQRGMIVDRFGVPMAANRQNYRVVIIAEQANDIESTLAAIATLIPLGESDQRKVLRDIRRKHPFVPVVVRDNLTWDEMSRIEVNVPELPGVSIEQGSSRYYPFGDKTSHILGYVAAVSEKELTGDPLLELPDFRIGKAGIEKFNDRRLRGTAGNSQVEVNAFGRVVREINRVEGDPGQQIVTTIDMALQNFTMSRIAAEDSATCVVLDALTGDVLAMASGPAYDSNTFSAGLTNAVWKDLTTNPRGPLNNKTIQGQYPPGSTFKPAVAMAALESGIITPDFRVTCTGSTSLGNVNFKCWRWPHGHGTLDLHGGIKNSCDCYFYEVARRVGPDRIAAMAQKLGFGSPTGIDIPNERPGLIPTTDWKLATYGVKWQQGETYNIGIGQGYVSVTPLQLATMLARLVTNRAVVPRLTRPGGVLKTGSPGFAELPNYASLGLAQKNLASVLWGMDAVCNEQGGTAYGSRITEPGMAMGGKSGTAQVRHMSQAEHDHAPKRPDQVPWKDRDHAVFIAFAPVGTPRYVCSVLIEHGFGGSAYAAPIARDVLRECQKRDPARSVPEDRLIADAGAPPPPRVDQAN
ncbi:MAG TPA: penicillin-binding protein 2 [Stellaceae bacterium]|nr:penicillin-binding protein 2 [Stellaceae bacterium]